MAGKSNVIIGRNKNVHPYHDGFNNSLRGFMGKLSVAPFINYVLRYFGILNGRWLSRSPLE